MGCAWKGSMKRSILKISSVCLAFLLIPFSSGCAGSSTTPANNLPATSPFQAVTVSPQALQVKRGTSRNFSAAVTNASDTTVTWSIKEGPSGGSITDAGVYTAPAVDG